MSRADGGLRSIIHTALKSGFMWQAIETGIIAPGVPDSYFASQNVSGWVESKRTHEWAVTLEPEQVGWLLRHARHGGRGFIAVRRWCVAGPRRPAADELWLLDGAFAALAKQNGLRGVPPEAILGRWRGGPGRWAWAEVAAILRGVGAHQHPGATL